MFNFAMIFPGQGSQHIGMLSSLMKKFSIIKEVFYQSSEVLGYDLLDLIQNGSKEDLNETFRAQPAILSTSFAIFKIWKEEIGDVPQIIAGHSLGEYSALVCSGVIKFKSAIKLVEIRGKLMKKWTLNKKGCMYAIIGLQSDLVLSLCKKASENQIVSISNFNSSNQVIISGEKEALKRAIILCELAGAKRIVKLSVTVPAHCALMKPASKEFSKKLNKIKFYTPRIPVVNNVDVQVESSIKLIKNALVRQLYKPVRWMEIIKFLVIKKKIRLLIEIGPSNILTSLTKNIVKKVDSISVNNVISLNYALKKIRERNEC